MKKILVIDDETDICTMLKDYLQLEGYLVYTAESGPEALSLMNIGPDLILLDINIPGMDGYEVCERIWEHVFCPIIFLSARVEDDGPGFSAGGLELFTGLRAARVAAILAWAFIYAQSSVKSTVAYSGT